MRTVEVSIGGRVYSMPVEFNSSMRLYEKGIDPLKLSESLANSESMTLFQVLTIIICGVRCAGCQLSDKAIGDEILELGPYDFTLIAAKYVVAFASGAPKIPVVQAKKNDETLTDQAA